MTVSDSFVVAVMLRPQQENRSAAAACVCVCVFVRRGGEWGGVSQKEHPELGTSVSENDKHNDMFEGRPCDRSRRGVLKC